MERFFCYLFRKEVLVVKHISTEKVMVVATMIAIDFVLSPLFRIEGMAPMSSVVNIIGAVLMGPLYVTIMATVCGMLRMLLLGIPPLALTGAVFGALLAGWGYHSLNKSIYGAMLGEILGTGIIGSILSYPVMVWFTGVKTNLFWLVYTPRFLGATLIGSAIAFFALKKFLKVSRFKQIQANFGTLKVTPAKSGLRPVQKEVQS